MGKLETRNKIIASAELLFSENGYDGVATKLIAKVAGISEMTLFNHFENKELLYKTVIDEKLQPIDLSTLYDELIYTDIEYDMRKISEKLIHNYYENKAVLQMKLKEKRNFLDNCGQKTEDDPVYTQLVHIFNKYIDKGLITFESGKLALLFITSLKGLLQVCMIEDQSDGQIKEMVDMFVSVFCNGLNKEKK